jgi:hypothetical protein
VRRQIGALALISVVVGVGCKESRLIPRGRAELTLSEIRLRGSTAVSRRIDSDEDFGKTVMDGIASGDSLWLEVAAAVQPASASAEASLAIALASALPRDPRTVLSMLGNKYPAEEVCGIPFLKADSSAVIGYHDEAARAIGMVRDSALTNVVAVCRAALDSSRNRRLERINPAYVIKNKPAPAPRQR